jgi:hypothetical protein
MSPIALSDEQMSAILRAAEPLHVADRSAFLEAVASALRAIANRAWWSSHAIITVEHNQSGARLCDLAEHADAWHGEVFAQSYLHGLNRPEAKRQVESLCYNA